MLELLYVATHVFSAAMSSGACEHNWSAYDFIHSKRCKHLKPSRVINLVYYFGNLHLLKVCNIATSSSMLMVV